MLGVTQMFHASKKRHDRGRGHVPSKAKTEGAAAVDLWRSGMLLVTDL